MRSRGSLARKEHANIASPAPPLGSLPRSTTEGSTSSRTSPCRRAWYRDDSRDVGFAIVATAGTPEHALEGAGHLRRHVKTLATRRARAVVCAIVAVRGMKNIVVAKTISRERDQKQPSPFCLSRGRPRAVVPTRIVVVRRLLGSLAFLNPTETQFQFGCRTLLHMARDAAGAAQGEEEAVFSLSFFAGLALTAHLLRRPVGSEGRSDGSEIVSGSRRGGRGVLLRGGDSDAAATTFLLVSGRGRCSTAPVFGADAVGELADEGVEG